MTREEAIQVLHHIVQVADTSDCGIKEIDGIDEEAIEIAIQALEQEPKTDVLDKIRAEQKALISINSTTDYSNGVMNCLNIIDKYRAESEDEK